MKNRSQLTARSLLLAAFGSILITASSMVVALRMSALPWPTVFVSVLAMALLNLFGRSNVHEINIAQTGMSAGAMIAGALAFTIPGLWISGLYQAPQAGETFWAWALPKALPIGAVTLCGVVLGSALSYLIRPRSLASAELPYPIGVAAAETLMAGDKGGTKAKILFSTLGLSAVVTLLRDLGPQVLHRASLIPSALSTQVRGLPIGLAVSPMALGIGYLIGLMPTFWWLSGALIAHWGIKVWAVQAGLFQDPQSAGGFILTLAVGLMVGSGLGILIQTLRSVFRALWKSGEKAAAHPNGELNAVPETSTTTSLPLTSPSRIRQALIEKKFVWLSMVLALIASLVAGLSVPASLLLIVGTGFAALMSAGITGGVGINPMEIFGILILLAIRILCTVTAFQGFLIAAAVAVACGFAGDLLNDYKMGQILGTDPTAQLYAQLVGAAFGIVVALLSLFALLYHHGTVGGDTGLSAAQAHSVASMVGGIGSPQIFAIALVVGLILYLLKIPAMIIGIGMLLSVDLAVVIFLGGLFNALIKRYCDKTWENHGQLIAAGCLGGEGLLSTILAIIQLTL